MDKRTFIGMVEAGEPLIQQAIDAMREYHQAQDHGAPAEEVERLRHSATNALLTRRDVIVVATVSAIYGLGTPEEYVNRMVRLRVGDEVDRDALLRRLVGIQ